MINLKELEIPIPRADTGRDQVAYELDHTFFSLFERSPLDTGHLKVNIHLEKALRHIQLKFSIEGEVELACDRTLALFNYPIQLERVVHFKIGDQNKEIDMDVYMIEEQSASISVAQHIYDFVNLSVPMKRLHPDLADQAEETEDVYIN